MTELKCHVGIGQCVEGEALVARDNFSARYDLDLTKGIFSRPNHDLTGESYVDKVLVFNTAKGGVASAWMLNGMRGTGLCPAGILFNNANTILAQGAALAGLTMVDRFEDGDVTDLIRSGDRIRVDPENGVVTVLVRGSPD